QAQREQGECHGGDDDEPRQRVVGRAIGFRHGVVGSLSTRRAGVASYAVFCPVRVGTATGGGRVVSRHALCYTERAPGFRRDAALLKESQHWPSTTTPTTPSYATTMRRTPTSPRIC